MSKSNRSQAWAEVRAVLATIVVTLAFMLAAVGVMVAGAQLVGATPDNGQVCAGLDSGKVDVSGDRTVVTERAPAGKLITGYCVKAGSARQGLGPEYVSLPRPVLVVTITHSSGKAISHFSLSYDRPSTTTSTVPSTTTSTVPSTTTSTVPGTSTTTSTVPGTSTSTTTVPTTVLPPAEPAEAQPGVPTFTG